jgi:hypothetical protein
LIGYLAFGFKIEAATFQMKSRSGILISQSYVHTGSSENAEHTRGNPAGLGRGNIFISVMNFGTVPPTALPLHEPKIFPHYQMLYNISS